jgi:hypothetical protein
MALENARLAAIDHITLPSMVMRDLKVDLSAWHSSKFSKRQTASHQRRR